MTINLPKAAAIVLAAALCACTRPPEIKRGQFPLPKDVEISECAPGNYGGVFVLAAAQEPKTFNPLIATDIYSSQIIDLMLSPLVTVDPFTMRTIPALAKSWSISEDKKTYTFHLREGVKFSDGAEITADDVIFTFQTIFAPQLARTASLSSTSQPAGRYCAIPSRYAGQYTIGSEPVKFKKTGKYSVEFSTAKAYAPFMTDIGFVGILPKHKLQKSADDGSFQRAWSTQTAISNPSEIAASGPFQIFSYKPGERLVLMPNPHYWRADKKGARLPYIDFLIYKFVADANTSTILFATGQCDASSVGANDYAWVKNYADTYNFKIYERGPDTGIYFIWFNQNPNYSPEGKPYVEPHKLKWFANKTFRQAVMKAIDRDGLIKSVWFGRAQKLDGIISPQTRNGTTPTPQNMNTPPKPHARCSYRRVFPTTATAACSTPRKTPYVSISLSPTAPKIQPQWRLRLSKT